MHLNLSVKLLSL